MSLCTPLISYQGSKKSWIFFTRKLIKKIFFKYMTSKTSLVIYLGSKYTYLSKFLNWLNDFYFLKITHFHKMAWGVFTLNLSAFVVLDNCLNSIKNTVRPYEFKMYSILKMGKLLCIQNLMTARSTNIIKYSLSF